MMDTNNTVELRILKTILWVYILLCIVIAGLNYGYASQATPSVAAFILRFCHFYENWIKTLFIIIGSFLTLRINGTSQRSTMRKRNLIGFIVSALVVHFGRVLYYRGFGKVRFSEGCLLFISFMVQSVDDGFGDWVGCWNPWMAKSNWPRSLFWFGRFSCFLSFYRLY